MHLDCSQAASNQAPVVICRKVDFNSSACDVSKKGSVKVKIRSLKIFCQQLKPPIPAVDSFTLPQHWCALGDTCGDTPGQYFHVYKPSEKTTTAWRFWCSGLHLHEDASIFFRKLLSRSTALADVNVTVQDLSSAELKSLLAQSTHSKISELSSAEVIEWNGRRVLSCHYLANPTEEASCNFKKGPLLKAWALIYDNASSGLISKASQAELSASPASIEFISSQDVFDAQLEAVRAAAKTIKWK